MNAHPGSMLGRVLPGVMLLCALIALAPALAYGGWSARVPISPNTCISGTCREGQEIPSVSCGSSSFCVAVDGSEKDFIYDGTAWRQAGQLFAGGNPLAPLPLSCPTSSFCMAVNTPQARTFNGNAWSPPTEIKGTSWVHGVSCPSASFCLAVEERGPGYPSTGDAVTYDGSSWSAPVEVDRASGLYRVSCSSASFCMALDGNGEALTYDGSSWSAPAQIDGTRLHEVSCSSASFCAALDQTGGVLTFNGSSWSAPVQVAGSLTVVSISCASSQFCMAIANKHEYSGYGYESGWATRYNGDSWSAPVEIDVFAGLTALSCPSESFCAAVDSLEFGLTYSPAPPSVAPVPPSVPPATIQPRPRCVVPSLKGLTLARARIELRNHGCSLGRLKFKRTHRKRSRNRVIGQSVRPGVTLASGARIGVVIGRFIGR
jgi:hypothetical protein